MVFSTVPKGSGSNPRWNFFPVRRVSFSWCSTHRQRFSRAVRNPRSPSRNALKLTGTVLTEASTPSGTSTASRSKSRLV